MIWVTNEHDLTDELKEAIRQNQDTLSAFVSVPNTNSVVENIPSSETVVDKTNVYTDEEFIAQIKAIDLNPGSCPTDDDDFIKQIRDIVL